MESIATDRCSIDSLIFMSIADAAAANNYARIKLLVEATSKCKVYLKDFLNQFVDHRDSLFYNMGLLHITSDPEIGEYLIGMGCDPSLRCPGYGMEPLHFAGGHTTGQRPDPITNERIRAYAELLISKGADVNVIGGMGFSPLYMAVSKNITPVAEVLIKHGADVNVTSNSGLTPLHNVTSMEMAKLLVEKGNAKLDIRVHSGHFKGKTPLETVPLLVDSCGSSNFEVGLYLFDTAMRRRTDRLQKLFKILNRKSLNKLKQCRSSYQSTMNSPVNQACVQWKKVRDEFLNSNHQVSSDEADEAELREQDLSEEFFKTYFLEMLSLRPKFAYRLLQKCEVTVFRSTCLINYRYDLLLVGSPLAHDNEVIATIVDSMDWDAVSSPVVQWVIQAKITLSLRERLLFEAILFPLLLALFFYSTSAPMHYFVDELRGGRISYWIGLVMLTVLSFRTTMLLVVHPRTRQVIEFPLNLAVLFKCLWILTSLFVVDLRRFSPWFYYCDILPVVAIWWCLIKYVDLLVPKANIGLALFIIRRMYNDLVRYLLILFAVTIAFAQSLTIVLAHSKAQMTLPRSFTFVYFTIFNPDVDGFLDSDDLSITQQMLSVTLVGFFCLIVSIVVVNLIVAVMSNTFDGIYNQSYRNTVIERCRMIIYLDTVDRNNMYIKRMFNKWKYKAGTFPEYPHFPRYVHSFQLNGQLSGSVPLTMMVLPTQWLIDAWPVHKRLGFGYFKKGVVRLLEYLFQFHHFYWPSEFPEFDEETPIKSRSMSVNQFSSHLSGTTTFGAVDLEYIAQTGEELAMLLKMTKGNDHTFLGHYNTISRDREA